MPTEYSVYYDLFCVKIFNCRTLQRSKNYNKRGNGPIIDTLQNAIKKHRAFPNASHIKLDIFISRAYQFIINYKTNQAFLNNLLTETFWKRGSCQWIKCLPIMQHLDGSELPRNISGVYNNARLLKSYDRYSVNANTF